MKSSQVTELSASTRSAFAGEKVTMATKSTPRVSTRATRYPNVVAVIPSMQGSAMEQAPPDLPSYLFKNRIVYLGMTLVPSVTELMLAELLYLQYDDATKPIFMYINSTGTTKNGQKMGYDTEAFAVYDTMMYCKPPIHTLCVGNAWGEASMLLAAGAKGHRGALPSASVMLKMPIAQFRGQATDIDIRRNEARRTKDDVIETYAYHIGKDKEELEKDISRPLYLTPRQAVDYGVIDKVLNADEVEAADAVRRSM